MTITFDTTRLVARFAAARAHLVPAISANLPDAAMMAIETSGYANAGFDEESTVDAAMLITDIEQSGSAVKIGIIQLYDWSLDPDAAHCFDPDGLDCPTFAARGPYTLETLPAQPGDGTTPCKDRCHCLVIPRDPIPASDITDALALAGSAVRVDLAVAWESV